MFCIPCKRRKKKRQREVGAGDEKSSSLQKSLQIDAPAPTPTTIPATSKVPKKVRKTSWWRLGPLYKKVFLPQRIFLINKLQIKVAVICEPPYGPTEFMYIQKKNETCLKQDVVEVAVLPPSVIEKSCSASKESQDGEVSVQVMASPAPDSPASAYNELQLQSDHIDETEDSVQPFSTTGEAIKCTEELEDAEDGDLDGSPASYTGGHLQTEQDSRAEETIMPSSATQQIVSAFYDTSAQVGVQVETSPDGDTLSSFTTEKDSHKVKDNRAEEAFLSSSATKQSLQKTRDVPNTELGYKGDSSLHPSPASKGTETDKRIKMALGLIHSPLVYDGRVLPVEGEEMTHIGPCSGSATDVSVSVLNKIQQNVSPQSDLFIANSNGHNNLKIKAEASAKIDTKMSEQSSTLDHVGSPQAEFNRPGLSAKLYKLLPKPYSSIKDTIPIKELVCLGLPNLGLTCYINATLQSLLTLSCFVQEIHNQMLVWGSHYKSQLFRGFLDIGVCRFSSIREEKKLVLSTFKRIIAEFNSDFEDSRQKDAHEFLICVLDLMRSLSPEMQLTAANLGLTYTCPVVEHIALQMLNTRTCTGCGERSHTVEDFVNLSLDLIPGGSVSQCLQEYFKEGHLEYMCHCGAQDSSVQSLFFTLPNVLILHLKRFIFTMSCRVQKITKPITLSRELVVKEECMATKDTTAHYSLVSVVSHIGSKADTGHYICDSIHRRQDTGDTADCWLTYDDEHVSQTTGEAVCWWRERNAFLLFYEKQPLKR
ncbi:hypothetical protein AMECASPLE_020021 [Ameca splendens]|uniref:USP domain-containing protein n=1 Tax=Ameca splendens TaxID=208324 RepID=A0ABV0YQ26_9TELE